MNFIKTKGLFRRITLPTRIQASSCTLIDNILTNNILTNNINETVQSKSGLLVNDISDHKIIFTHITKPFRYEKPFTADRVFSPWGREAAVSGSPIYPGQF